MTNETPKPEITPKHLHILRHSIGLDDKAEGREYRNHFATGPETVDWTLCVELCELGLMVDRGPLSAWGGMHCFQVTENGKATARIRPEREKLSRSKARYQEYLDGTGCMKFGDWLKAKAKQERQAR